MSENFKMATLDERLKAGRLRQQLAKARQKSKAFEPPIMGDPGLIGAEQGGLPILARASELFGSGFNEGFANVVGLPVDVINAGLRKVGVPVSDVPIGGSESLRRGLGFLAGGTIQDVPPPSGVAGRVLQRTGEEIGATLPALGLGLAAAPRIAKGSRLRDFLQPLAEQPAKATAIELAAASGAGIGAQTARESFPESPVAEMTGQVAGGLTAAGSIGAVQRLSRVARRLGRKVAEPFTQQGIERGVGRVLEEASGRPPVELAEAIGRGQEVGAGAGIRPTTAQAAENRGLLTLERGVSRTSPEARGELEDIISAQRRGIRTSLEDVIPEGRPQAVSESVDEEIRNFRTALERTASDADERVRDAISAAGSRPQGELNIIARKELIATEKVLEDEAQDLFRRIDPTGRVIVTMNNLKRKVKDLAKSVKKAEKPENLPEVAGVIDRFNAEESLDEIMALRSRITDDIRSETAQLPPNRRLLARLEKLKDDVDDAIISDIKEPPGMEAAESFRKARQNFRTFAELFRRGTVARVLRGGRLGETSLVPESATIGQFFRPGKGAVEAAQDFQRVLGNNQAARQAVKESVIQDFANFATNANGQLNTQKANLWINRHRAALESFPDIKNDVANIVRKGGQAETITRQVDQTIQRVERSAARFFINTDPDKAATRVLNSQNPTESLRQLVTLTRRSKEGLNGLRTAIWNKAIRQAETITFDEEIAAFFLSPKGLRRFFERFKQSFVQSGLYSPDEIRQTERIIRAAEQVNQSVVSGLTGGSDTAQNLVGTPFLGILGRVIGARIGRIFGTIQSAGLGARVGKQVIDKMTGGQATATLQRALIDPEVAKTLLTRPTTGLVEDTTIRRLRAHLVNLGPVALKSREEETHAQPLGP